MNSYRVTMIYENLDNFLGTPHQAAMDIIIRADDIDHAYLLAQKLTKVFEADNYIVDPIA